MRQHQRRRGNALAMACGRHVDHDAEIQVLVVKPRDQAIGRFAHDRKYPDDIGAAGLVRRVRSRFQAKRRHHAIAQGQQRVDPSRRAPQHPLRCLPRIERVVVDRDAVGIAELRAGQQRTGVGVRIDSTDFHGGAPGLRAAYKLTPQIAQYHKSCRNFMVQL